MSTRVVPTDPTPSSCRTSSHALQPLRKTQVSACRSTRLCSFSIPTLSRSILPPGAGSRLTWHGRHIAIMKQLWSALSISASPRARASAIKPGPGDADTRTFDSNTYKTSFPSELHANGREVVGRLIRTPGAKRRHQQAFSNKSLRARRFKTNALEAKIDLPYADFSSQPPHKRAVAAEANRGAGGSYARR